MSLKHKSPNANLQIAWPIVLLGSALGGVLAWGVLSGDQQGRVNLLYLLLVYLFLPLAGLIISTTSLLGNRGFNFARLIVALPVWSNEKRMLMRKTQQLRVEKAWLFFQSHLAALGFSITSLLVFFVLLLATDINFVWRSTLLNAADLQPLLKSIAAPWFFWSEAQPSVALLEATQDSRIETVRSAGGSHADWWRFVLAVQLFYCVILRGSLLAVTAWVFKAKASKDFEQKIAAKIPPSSKQDEAHENYRPTVSVLPDKTVINNWAKIDLNWLSRFTELDFSTENILNGGPLATAEQRQIAEACEVEQVVLVKAWEPPLGELSDFLQTGKGFIWPVDWQADSLVPLRPEHLQEWRRFANDLPDWQVFLPLEFMPKTAP